MSHAEMRPLAFVNADIAGHGPGTLRVLGERICSLGAPVEAGDRVVDLRGDRLLPGIINAHDHLQLNHYPRLKYRARHGNASEWVADIEARRHVDPVLTGGASVPRVERLRIGIVKNLLCGATTVAQHDPLYPELDAETLPIHLLSRFGWAHSLAVDGIERVQESHRQTPADAPWFIHAGEGTDAAAADEARQLEALGVCTPNTLLIHGLGFDARTRARLVARGVGLVWCPGSNLFLFDRVASVAEFDRAGQLALGSDSRLSGERDLLDELNLASRTGGIGHSRLESLVTRQAARLLRLPDRGLLRAGAVADLLVLPRGARLWDLRRGDLRCVMTAGEMRCGDADLAELLLPAAKTVPATVDGQPKCLEISVARLLQSSSISEPGVHLSAGAMRAA
jgi:cytosine/adenosine deaminase-related metal-dependent hydrolase